VASEPNANSHKPTAEAESRRLCRTVFSGAALEHFTEFRGELVESPGLIAELIGAAD
jgi:hypothetical protein